MTRKNRITFRKMLLSIAVLINSYAYGNYQFEGGIPENIIVGKNSKIEISKEIVKDGEQSLKWKFKKGDKLSIKGDVGYKPFQEGGKEKSRASFAMWIYNKTPIKDKLKVEFKKYGETKSYFEINMDFTGWRTMWVQYDRDMKGRAITGMDEIVFVAPNSDGEIYLDQIIPSILIDPRYNARDEQVNFVNLSADYTANAHWMALYKNYNQIKKSNLNEITSQEKIGLQKIEEKLRENILKNVKVKDKNIREKREKLEEYKKQFLATPQLIEIYEELPKEEFMLIDYLPLQEFGTYLRELAYMYNSTNNKKQQEDIYSIFREALDFMYSQGWTKGSSQGTIHHLGYNIREVYQSILLMREPLLSHGDLAKAKEMVMWYSAMGMIYTPIEEIKGVNIDVLNTMLPGMLTAIMLNEDERVATAQLRQFNNYLAYGINYTPGLSGGFKDDGSVFHHMQNYPAYAKGAFEGLTPIIYYLGNTDFALDETAYNKVKKSVLMSRIYSNKYNWLISISGRHPNDSFKISTDVFGYAAYGKKEGIDKELAEAYLRLDSDGKFAKEFKKLGYREEETPNGAWTMNMGSLQLHRRDEWLVGVKGFSRYLVGNETYKKNNLYGRYMSYGTVQILQNSLKESGFVQEGWNWAHYPGATAIALPLEEMKSSIAQVDTFSGIEEMLLSDETYSGGNNLNNNGMFAMKLHENPKYNGSHRARKSVFFFDNRVVLLGSNIENDDKVNETHTTLFQNYLGDGKIEKVEKVTKGDIVLVDSQNNIYAVADGEVHYKREKQHSFDQKEGTPTENNYELAYINHGKNPKDKGYEYSILVKGNEEEQNKFKIDKGYEVLKKDYNAHIVEDKVSKMRGYALFESGKIKDRYISEIDTPSMIMIAPMEAEIELSFVDPDLRLYEGRDENQYDKNGKMREVSIYSRAWNKNNSIPHTSKVVLNGKYKLEENKGIKVEYKNEKTILYITTTYSKVIKIKLQKI